ncbi:MAG: hypothetical protein M3O33_23290, partial [Cyanobacteriota bacterium]|nr:hypothetical protein [Cyanobacteriota bacterium]
MENIHNPLLASALREMLKLAGFLTSNMLIGSNFGICATVKGKIVFKAPDWVYVPSVLPVPVGVIRRSYTPHTEGEVPAVVMKFLSDTEQGEYSSKSTYLHGKWYFYATTKSQCWSKSSLLLGTIHPNWEWAVSSFRHTII